MLKVALKLAAINAGVFFILLAVVELVFGNWVRPMTVTDLKRFSIPVDVKYEFDASKLYEAPNAASIRYTRDQWGLRGSYRGLADIDVLTIGGSTADQKFLDDSATWQSVAERALANSGIKLTFANAGVDGQSTTGHLFDFDHWFPLLSDLHPNYILFYAGINDVMRHDYRVAFDSALDASSWRVKSASWQLVRLIRGGLNAKNAQVVHGRKPAFVESDFSSAGQLDPELRDSLAHEVATAFIGDIAKLRRRAESMGAIPIFLTQTAFAWHAGRGTARGLTNAKPVVVHGHLMNFADVSFLHQQLNERLLVYCADEQLTCLDVASDVVLEADDYYDWVHTTPKGAKQIGEYVAKRLAELWRSRPRALPSSA